MNNEPSRLTFLCNATFEALPLDVAVPAYNRRILKAGIAHIGVGNFHRAHEALYVDRCLHLPDQQTWAICGIGLGDGAAARAKAEAFHRQDGLYTLTEFDPEGAFNTRVIGSIIEYLHAPSDSEAVARKLADPAIRIVSLTITEGGYNIDESTGEFLLGTPEVAAELAGGPLRTAFGYIVEGLRRRRRSSVQPFTVVSCDNLRRNGDTARRAIVSFARALDPELAEWIDTSVSFPNSMVDRIAPRVSDANREKLNRLSGAGDAIAVTGESFTQWVIEDKFNAGRPHFDRVGVELRDDVPAFEGIKGRMLNASHMMLSYPALLCGYRLVHEAVADARLVKLLERFMELDVIPLLEAPSGVSLQAYKKQVLSRFTNVAVADQLLRIAHDGVSKIPVFHFKTLLALVQSGGDIRREAFFLACFQQYFRGVDDAGNVFEVQEPRISAADWEILKSLEPFAILRTTAFRAMNLQLDPAFSKAFLAVVRTIEKAGASGALDEVLSA